MVKRDIAAFYDQQADEYQLSGAVDFGTLFKLPYWDYLDVRNIDEPEAEYVRTNCLVILTAIAFEPFEELGMPYIGDQRILNDLTKAIRGFIPLTSDHQQLKMLIIDLLEAVRTKSTIKHLDSELQWIYVKFIYGYFRNRADSFGRHLETLYKKYEERDNTRL
ncbi:hypothetical protein RT717_05655 [Imperialibacter roseus]|uniref:Uncharacterized protein n=1 Tax=Imperialibacter roseus TaxID=1324217 RepID=A0ABZ0ISU1_9BACT|nr:hypothetical protein [Imperialibacter roseus]WOK08118.1 hypothetical protein RT717_05655 [Imperialibacter roseus]